MNRPLEKNEIADATAQKAPSLSAQTGSSSDSNSGDGAKSFRDGANSKDAAVTTPILNHLPTASMVYGGPAATDSAHDIGQVNTAADKAVQLTHLISHEAMTLRQSGAASLAVSLKVDPQTELLLQLRNHGGRIEATLHCERGDVSGLERHWSQLQESLARQNIYLNPPSDKFFRRGGEQNFSNGNSNSQLSDRETPKQPNAFQEVFGQNPNPVATASNKKARAATTTQPAGNGWESWA